MNCISKNKLELIRQKYPKGCVVELIEMEDVQAPKKGTQGKVMYIDDIGTIQIQWENGSSLGVIYGLDRIERVNL